MHYEILVEDKSGKVMLDILLPKILDTEKDDYRIIDYRGIGHIPKGMKSKTDASKRILLDRLPSLLRGYGKTFRGYDPGYPSAVIVVCDLDQRCLKEFRQELLAVLHACNPQPITRFCIAIEEGEAWLMGSPEAIRTAYPKAKKAVLEAYQNDSICGTWQRLADAIYPGGSEALQKEPYHVIGMAKSEWAKQISGHIDIEDNASPSFQYFRLKVEELAG